MNVFVTLAKDAYDRTDCTVQLMHIMDEGPK